LFLSTTAELADLEQRDDRPGIEEPEKEQEQEHEENEDNKLLVDNIVVTAFVVVVVAAMVLIAAAATATISTKLPHKKNAKIATTKSSRSTTTELQREFRERQAQQQTLSQEQEWFSSFGEDDPTEKLFNGLYPGREKIYCG
jgi:CO dehydrogenase/acetyl-CoA synthase beta subunit